MERTTAERVAVRAFLATRLAKELVKVWVVRDPTPTEVNRMGGAKADALVFEMTIPRLVDYLSKIGLSRWNRDKGSLYTDPATALQDAEQRIYRFENRFRLQATRVAARFRG